MAEDHEQKKPEAVDDLNEITNQLNSTALEVSQQRTAAVPTTHTSGSRLLSHVPQLATTRKDPVTFWSLPREVRDLIWSEVLGSEDDIFQANVTKFVCDTQSEASAHWYATQYQIVEEKRRKDGRFDMITSASILLCSRPPLPLAHLCQESRGFALQKYDAAYRKVRDPDLHQERGGRFRWLSRSTPRLMHIYMTDGDHYQTHLEVTHLEVPLGEDEPLILICHQINERSWRSTGNSLKQTALLELLRKAKDYQIMMCFKIGLSGHGLHLIDRNVAQKWGVFADRAPGKDIPEDRAIYRPARTFVEVRDMVPMVQLLRDINRRGRTVGLRSLGLKTHIVRGNTTTIMSRIDLLAPILRSYDLPYFTADGFRRLEEDELFPYGNFVTNLKYRNWLQEMFSECLELFENLWAENVNEDDISSQSRYGRMPKIGLVVEQFTWYTWAHVQPH